MIRLAGIGALAFAALTATLDAHHSSAMFNREVTLVLTGVVKQFDYLNPHSWLYVDVTNEDGAVTEWGFELSSPTLLRREGVSPSFWKVGEPITVRTNPLIDGRPAGNMGGAITAEGKTFGNTNGLEPPSEQD
jgi:hypothetical protein